MLSPPSDPFVTNVEREIIILVSVLVAWGLVHGLYRNGSYFMRSLLHRWASLGIKAASLVRANTDHIASIHEILAGNYLEAAVSSNYLPKFYSKLVL
jgi:hypothetical protein